MPHISPLALGRPQRVDTLSSTPTHSQWQRSVAADSMRASYLQSDDFIRWVPIKGTHTGMASATREFSLLSVIVCSSAVPSFNSIGTTGGTL